MALKILTPRFYSSSPNASASVRKEGVPPWDGDGYKSVNNWYYSQENTQYHYNIVESANKYTIYVQYGQNTAVWASARFLCYDIEILSESINPDNSVSIHYNLRPRYFKGQPRHSGTGGVRCYHEIKYGTRVLATYDGDTGDHFNLNMSSHNLTNLSTVIKPNDYTVATTLRWLTEYPDGQYQMQSINFGLSFYNPNPPIYVPKTYIPMSIRKGGKWEALDGKGFIKGRRSSKWVDFSEESFDTKLKENAGKNRIRRSSKWLQLPPMS